MRFRLFVSVLALCLAVGLVLSACQTCRHSKTLKDFSSDGCSLFPDASLIDAKDWCACCFEHDIAYWQGGTAAQRLEADKKLRDCVLAKTDDSTLAEAMFQGVRFGGGPWFNTWYRWGYGWSYDRKYQPLTPEEKQLVAKKLKKYFERNEGFPCETSLDETSLGGG